MHKHCPRFFLSIYCQSILRYSLNPKWPQETLKWYLLWRESTTTYSQISSVWCEHSNVWLVRPISSYRTYGETSISTSNIWDSREEPSNLPSKLKYSSKVYQGLSIGLSSLMRICLPILLNLWRPILSRLWTSKCIWMTTAYNDEERKSPAASNIAPVVYKFL